ncbi:hypothetical protein OAE97_01460 [Verrucomicrobia bacterium]|nr:hypothetical protein [Verrucomicrobiota bacterium]
MIDSLFQDASIKGDSAEDMDAWRAGHNQTGRQPDHDRGKVKNSSFTMGSGKADWTRKPELKAHHRTQS